MAKKKAAKPVGKKPAKRSTAGAVIVKIELTAEQQAQLEQVSKGRFTTATFAFGKGKKIAPPEHKVSCRLARVAH